MSSRPKLSQVGQVEGRAESARTKVKWSQPEPMIDPTDLIHVDGRVKLIPTVPSQPMSKVEPSQSVLKVELSLSRPKLSQPEPKLSLISPHQRSHFISSRSFERALSFLRSSLSFLSISVSWCLPSRLRSPRRTQLIITSLLVVVHDGLGLGFVDHGSFTSWARVRRGVVATLRADGVEGSLWASVAIVLVKGYLG
ncbi:hypothetical protein V8G54_000361 [Vigna mungo]|uniref:Uncharacterized protein n=1 Tax=Vigna mungo TaxID=3915 RepID=A0AAQ3P6Y4_VIGMU